MGKEEIWSAKQGGREGNLFESSSCLPLITVVPTGVIAKITSLEVPMLVVSLPPQLWSRHSLTKVCSKLP